MGIADLIPGISGGTVAFICGIYENLLESIKTLQFQSFRKISWSFLLPLIGGIATAILVFSRLFFFLLKTYPAPLLSFFLGAIAASTLFCFKQATLNRPRHYIVLISSVLATFLMILIPPIAFFTGHFFGLVCSGILGGCVMLLPGVSGSYLLHLLGVYTLALTALSTPADPNSLKILGAIALGVSLGWILFSRVVSFLLVHFRQMTLASLIGFMIGGMHSLWPCERWDFALIGFIIVILLELNIQKKPFTPSL